MDIASSAVRNLNDFELNGRQLRLDYAENDNEAKKVDVGLVMIIEIVRIYLRYNFS